MVDNDKIIKAVKQFAALELIASNKTHMERLADIISELHSGAVGLLAVYAGNYIFVDCENTPTLQETIDELGEDLGFLVCYVVINGKAVTAFVTDTIPVADENAGDMYRVIEGSPPHNCSGRDMGARDFYNMVLQCQGCKDGTRCANAYHDGDHVWSVTVDTSFDVFDVKPDAFSVTT